MNEHLAKPIDRNVLRQAIAIWTLSSAWKREFSDDASDAAQRFAGNANGAQAALETELLLELFDGDGSAVSALLEAAMTSIVTDIDRIEAAAGARDAAALADAAERLKTTAGSLRAKRLADVSACIERSAHGQAWTTLLAYVAELQLAADRLRLEIDARYRNDEHAAQPAGTAPAARAGEVKRLY